ncbi:helicase [Microscilla marina ATCC 23134]|uniref:Helicase n=2 Tax=Microscilla marina TaxID=1027 RepID=A1ZEK8_MICM2|nr:helicase [Microscilla marina ATCC 23134]
MLFSWQPIQLKKACGQGYRLFFEAKISDENTSQNLSVSKILFILGLMEDKEWTYPFDKPYSWDWRDEQWYVRYLELKAYKKIYGDCRVPVGWAKNKALGNWVSAQRINKMRMVSWRKELLNKLGFTWQVQKQVISAKYSHLSKKEGGWMTTFDKLSAYFKKTGHITASRQTPEGIKLSCWESKQRGRRKQGKLSKKRIELLDSIGFSWSLKEKWSSLPVYDDLWNDRFAELKAFQTKHGHCNPSSEIKETKTLAHWVLSQRERFKGGKILPHRKVLLDGLGFEWSREDKARASVVRDKRWLERFEALKAFYAEHGHFRVPRTSQELSVLCTWLVTQRHYYRKGLASQQHIELLNSIGFDWESKETEKGWLKMLEKLKAFHTEHGHFRVPHSSEELKELADWATTQRHRLRKNKLDSDKVNLLQEIGVSPNDGAEAKLLDEENRWTKRFNELKEFKSIEGHFQVPTDKPVLRNWVGTQRALLKKGKLKPNRKALLDHIDFAWSYKGKTPVLEQAWEVRFKQLKAFKAEHGHFNIPKRDSVLGSLNVWAAYQRACFKKGTLSKGRINLLNSIGFVWNFPKTKKIN